MLQYHVITCHYNMSFYIVMLYNHIELHCYIHITITRHYNIMKLYFIDWIGAWRLADFKITIRGATYDGWGYLNLFTARHLFKFKQ